MSSEAVCDDEDGVSSEQGKDNPTEPILLSIQAFVRKQPSTAGHDDVSDFTEPGAVRLTDLADVWSNPVT